MRQGYLYPELTDMASLASQLAPGIFSLTPKCWDCKCRPPSPHSVYLILGIQPQVMMTAQQYFPPLNHPLQALVSNFVNSGGM